MPGERVNWGTSFKRRRIILTGKAVYRIFVGLTGELFEIKSENVTTMSVKIAVGMKAHSRNACIYIM